MVIEIGAFVLIVCCAVYVEINERKLDKRLARKELDE